MDFEPAASFAFVLAYSPRMQQETSQVDKGPSPTICAGFAQLQCLLRNFFDQSDLPAASTSRDHAKAKDRAPTRWPRPIALCNTELVVFGRGGKGSAGPGALTGVRSAVRLFPSEVGVPARVAASFLGPGSAIGASGAPTLGSETAVVDLFRLLGRTSTGPLS